MTIHIASDHAGFELKEKLKLFIEELGHSVVDHGAEIPQEDDDYPDFIHLAAEAVSKNSDSRGIIIGGSGQGEAMVANKHKNVRAGVYYGQSKNQQQDSEGQTLSIISSMRKHNDANMLSLGARFMSDDEAKEAVRLFIEIPFSDAIRHIRRIKKIDQ